MIILRDILLALLCFFISFFIFVLYPIFLVIILEEWGDKNNEGKTEEKVEKYCK